MSANKRERGSRGEGGGGASSSPLNRRLDRRENRQGSLGPSRRGGAFDGIGGEPEVGKRNRKNSGGEAAAEEPTRMVGSQVMMEDDDGETGLSAAPFGGGVLGREREHLNDAAHTRTIPTTAITTTATTIPTHNHRREFRRQNSETACEETAVTPGGHTRGASASPVGKPGSRRNETAGASYGADRELHRRGEELHRRSSRERRGLREERRVNTRNTKEPASVTGGGIGSLQAREEQPRRQPRENVYRESAPRAETTFPSGGETRDPQRAPREHTRLTKLAADGELRGAAKAMDSPTKTETVGERRNRDFARLQEQASRTAFPHHEHTRAAASTADHSNRGDREMERRRGEGRVAARAEAAEVNEAAKAEETQREKERVEKEKVEKERLLEQQQKTRLERVRVEQEEIAHKERERIEKLRQERLAEAEEKVKAEEKAEEERAEAEERARAEEQGVAEAERAKAAGADTGKGEHLVEATLEDQGGAIPHTRVNDEVKMKDTELVSPNERRRRTVIVTGSERAALNGENERVIVASSVDDSNRPKKPSEWRREQQQGVALQAIHKGFTRMTTMGTPMLEFSGKGTNADGCALKKQGTAAVACPGIDAGGELRKALAFRRQKTLGTEKAYHAMGTNDNIMHIDDGKILKTASTCEMDEIEESSDVD